MNAKFYSSNVIGKIPADGSLGEREIALNLGDGKIYSSDNGQDIIEMGTAGTVGPFDILKRYESGNLVTISDKIYIAKNDIAPGAFDATEWYPVSSGASGATTFLGLSDTPSVAGSDGELLMADATGNIVYTNVIDCGTF